LAGTAGRGFDSDRVRRGFVPSIRGVGYARLPGRQLQADGVGGRSVGDRPLTVTVPASGLSVRPGWSATTGATDAALKKAV
jgi:hypothetical protein